jgi:ABC-type multidrug transport system ATPase subunit
MESKNSLISIKNLKKTFHDVIALDDMCLEIPSGIFGLIGPNGAGKTTLLRVLLGLAKPDNGSATVFGCDVGEYNEYFKKIGVLHEKPYFPQHMTPLRYLRRVGKLYPRQIPAEELLEIVDLSNAANRNIGKLSAGMHQRLGIAQALVGKPQLVLLDEPTANLDVSGRDLVVRLIVRLYNESDISFFITSHILSELERACHNVAFIKSGRVVEEGAVEQVIERNTENRFRVTTTDAKLLQETIIKMQIEEQDIVDFVSEIFVDGASSVIIEVSKNQIHSFKSRLDEIAEKVGSKIIRIENTGTLEDVYRKVI